uniref:MFS domain-containing protein n=1 Tax=Ascaris lumbricoides TaxID=6252 RepID=A0A0M3HRM4_ASCLU
MSTPAQGSNPSDCSQRLVGEDIEHLVYDSSVSAVENADEILAQLGARNKYILLVTITLSFAWTIGAMPIMCSAFIVDNGECMNDTECEEENRTSIVSDFELTDERKYMADWTTSAFMFGNMLGASALTRISDRIGRRPVLLFSLMTLSVTGAASVLADSIHVFTFGRFLQGICSPGICLVVWVLGYECIPMSLRGCATLIYGTMWVIGYCALAPMAYFLTSWRTLLLASTLPAGITCIFFFFVVPESLHFLVVNRRNADAMKWVKRAKKYGYSESDVNLDKMMEALFISTAKRHDTLQSKRSGNNELLANKIFILYTLVLTFLWTSDTFVYFGLSIYATRIAGNKYWNYALSGLIEMPAYLFAPHALDNFGRKPIVAWTHFLAGFSLIALIFIPNGMEWMTTPLWLMGKFAISCSFMCIFVYGSEIFPTTIRNACIGLCSVIARVGGIVAPYVKLLESISPLLPMVFFGSVSVAAGVLTLLLPETKDRALPSSLSDLREECE